MSTCSVCCEKFNKTIRKQVICPFCNFETCKTCTQTYLLSSTEDAHCMNCKHEHTRDFVDSFCTKHFRNVEYKLHRERVLFEREKARMPETQPKVEKIYKIRKLKKIYYNTLKYIRSLRAQRYDAYAMEYPTDYYDELIENADLTIENLHEEIIILTNEFRYGGDIDASEISKFVVHCPIENCRGFLNDEMYCSLCEKTFCEHCNEEKENDHVCNPDLVKTMKLINKDTKPCPKCATMISKIDGCSQMWCTQCHTAFDWRTGRIEVGRVHNPHYFEFKKRTREHADIPCGGRPSYDELYNLGACPELIKLSAYLTYIDRQLIYKYGDLYDDDNERLRMSYMLKDISEYEFKVELQRRDKYKCKVSDIRNIYNMFSDSCGDLLRQWVLDSSQIDKIIQTIDELTEYTNKIIESIRSRYNSQVPYNIFVY